MVIEPVVCQMKDQTPPKTQTDLLHFLYNCQWMVLLNTYYVVKPWSQIHIIKPQWCLFCPWYAVMPCPPMVRVMCTQLFVYPSCRWSWQTPAPRSPNPGEKVNQDSGSRQSTVRWSNSTEYIAKGSCFCQIHLWISYHIRLSCKNVCTLYLFGTPLNLCFPSLDAFSQLGMQAFRLLSSHQHDNIRDSKYTKLLWAVELANQDNLEQRSWLADNILSRRY